MAFTLRAYREADFDAALALVNEAARADGTPYLVSEPVLRARLAAPHDAPGIDAAQDAWVAELPGAGVAAYGDGVLRGETGKWMYRTECFVRPGFRRQGLGRALLERQWARAQDLSAQLGGQKIVLGARAFDTQTDALALFEALGMQRMRYFFTMRRDLSQPLPALQVPPGLSLRVWDERRAERTVWAAVTQAFADHWGYYPETFEAFQQRVRLGSIQPEYSFIAWDGDEVAGGALNRMERAPGETEAWVGILFVRRAWRKRGLGCALLAASLELARQQGHPSIILNVDAENLTGAVRLYESVGFVVAATRVAYNRTWPEG